MTWAPRMSLMGSDYGERGFWSLWARRPDSERDVLARGDGSLEASRSSSSREIPAGSAHELIRTCSGTDSADRGNGDDVRGNRATSTVGEPTVLPFHPTKRFKKPPRVPSMPAICPSANGTWRDSRIGFPQAKLTSRPCSPEQNVDRTYAQRLTEESISL